MRGFRGGLENILLDVSTYLDLRHAAHAEFYLQPAVTARYLARSIETGGDYPIFPPTVASKVAGTLADEFGFQPANAAVLGAFRGRVIDLVQQLWDRRELVWLDSETRFYYKGVTP